MAASRGDHARIMPGTLINNRYEVGSEMGRGNFSVVYSAKDKAANNSIVALKFVKKEYAHDAKFEHDILKAIREANPNGNEKVLMMLDHFAYNRHPCFVLAPKGCPLKARRFGVREGHVSRTELRALATQMLEALAFIHFKMRLVHTDLKPENILLDSNPAPNVKGLGEGFTIVDFGSASFYRMDRLDSDLISTRPYRSPEVVLGNGWYYPADTWSMGCILYEVYTGHKLFDVSDDNIHLAQMSTRLGPLPKLFTTDSQNSRRFFDGTGNLLRGNLRAAPYIRSVAEELKDDPAFMDLIMSMLAYEPSRRIRCDDALRHPFITGEGAAVRKAPSPMADIPTPVSARQPLGAANMNNLNSAAGNTAAPLMRKDMIQQVHSTATSARTTPANSLSRNTAHHMAPSTSNGGMYDKENAVRAVPTVKPLYNNIRLPSSGMGMPPTGGAPLSARGGVSANPYGTHHHAAPLTSRPPLVSPAASQNTMQNPHYGYGASGAVTRVPSVSSMQGGGMMMDDRLGALKRTKSDPSLMPVAGRASGLTYTRAW